MGALIPFPSAKQVTILLQYISSWHVESRASLALATNRATWLLPRPDFHRQARFSLQSTRLQASLHAPDYRRRPTPLRLRPLNWTQRLRYWNPGGPGPHSHRMATLARGYVVTAPGIKRAAELLDASAFKLKALG